MHDELLYGEKPGKDVVSTHSNYPDKIDMCDNNIAYRNETRNMEETLR